MKRGRESVVETVEGGESFFIDGIIRFLRRKYKYLEASSLVQRFRNGGRYFVTIRIFSILLHERVIEYESDGVTRLE